MPLLLLLILCPRDTFQRAFISTIKLEAQIDLVDVPSTPNGNIYKWIMNYKDHNIKLLFILFYY